jgi:hypothetical protein
VEGSVRAKPHEPNTGDDGGEKEEGDEEAMPGHLHEQSAF